MPTRTRLDNVLLALLGRAPGTANALARRLAGFPLGGLGSSPGAVYPAIRRLEKDGLIEGFDKPRNEAAAEYRRRARSDFHAGRPVPYGRRRRPERRFRAWALTGEGWKVVREWGRRPPGIDAMRARPEELLLRFLVLGGFDPETPPDEWIPTPYAKGTDWKPTPLPGWRKMLESARPRGVRRSDAGRTRVFLEAYADLAEQVSTYLEGELRCAQRTPISRHPYWWVGRDPSWEWRMANELRIALLETRTAWARRAIAELDASRSDPAGRRPAAPMV